MRTTRERIKHLVKQIPKFGEEFVIDHIAALFETTEMELEVCKRVCHERNKDTN